MIVVNVRSGLLGAHLLCVQVWKRNLTKLEHIYKVNSSKRNWVRANSEGHLQSEWDVIGRKSWLQMYPNLKQLKYTELIFVTIPTTLIKIPMWLSKNVKKTITRNSFFVNVELILYLWLHIITFIFFEVSYNYDRKYQ